MEKYWFKPRKTGFGMRPITWEGWAASASLAILIIGAAYVNKFFTGNITVSNGIHFLFETLCFTGAFTLLFKNRVEGGLQWRGNYENEERQL